MRTPSMATRRSRWRLGLQHPLLDEPAFPLNRRLDHDGRLAVDRDVWCVNLQAVEHRGKLRARLEGVDDPVREPFRRGARRQDQVDLDRHRGRCRNLGRLGVREEGLGHRRKGRALDPLELFSGGIEDRAPGEAGFGKGVRRRAGPFHRGRPPSRNRSAVSTPDQVGGRLSPRGQGNRIGGERRLLSHRERACRLSDPGLDPGSLGDEGEGFHRSGKGGTPHPFSELTAFAKRQSPLPILWERRRPNDMRLTCPRREVGVPSQGRQ